jgi:hypothetical protein
MKLLGLDVEKYWSGETATAAEQDDMTVPEAKRFKQDTAVEQQVA